jgi:hypothetical protein
MDTDELDERQKTNHSLKQSAFIRVHRRLKNNRREGAAPTVGVGRDKRSVSGIPAQAHHPPKMPETGLAALIPAYIP